MIVYEFYLRDEFKANPFESLCMGFYQIGGGFKRKVDGVVGSGVYAVSRSFRSHWVQLLVDDNTPDATLTAVESRINGLMDERDFDAYPSPYDQIAPPERRPSSEVPEQWGRRLERKEGLVQKVKGWFRRLTS